MLGDESFLPPRPTEPKPEEGGLWEGIKGAGISAGIGGLKAVDYVLGLPDRGAHTIEDAIVTGKITEDPLGTAWNAVRNTLFTPSETPTLEQTLGEVTRKTGVEFGVGKAGEWDMGDFINVPAYFGADVLRSPSTYFSFGILPSARKLSGAGISALKALEKGGQEGVEAVARYAALHEAQTGLNLTAEEALKKVRAGGLEATLSKRLAAGEASYGFHGIGASDLSMGLPGELGKKLAPVVAAGEKVVDIARGIGKSTIQPLVGERVYGAAESVVGAFLPSTGVRGLDIMMNIREDATHTMKPAIDAAIDAQRFSAAKKFTEEEIGTAVKMAEQTQSDLHRVSLEGTVIGERYYKTPAAKIASDAQVQRVKTDLAERFAARRGTVAKTADELIAAGTPVERVRDIQMYAQKVSDALEITRRVATSVPGVQVEDIGTSTLRAVREGLDELDDFAKTMGFSGKEIGDTPVNLFLKDILDGPGYDGIKDMIRKRLDEFNIHLDNAATVPGFIPLRIANNKGVRDVLLKAERSDPGILRRMSDATGSIYTVEEANAAIQKAGTAATAGRAIKGRVSIGDLTRVMLRGWKKDGLTGVQLELAEAAEKGGAMFTKSPATFLGDYLEGTIRVVDSQMQQNMLANVFGDSLPAEVGALINLRDEMALKLKQAGKSREEAKKILAEFAPRHESILREARKAADAQAAGGWEHAQKKAELAVAQKQAAEEARAGLETSREGLFRENVNLPMAEGAEEVARAKARALKPAEFVAEGQIPPALDETLPRATAARETAERAVANAEQDVAQAGRFAKDQAGAAKLMAQQTREATSAAVGLERKAFELGEKVGAIQNFKEYEDVLKKFRELDREVANWHPGKGYVKASHLGFAPKDGRDFLLTAPVAEAYTRMKEMTRDPRFVAGAAQLWRDLSRGMKILQLTAPGSWARNWIGNTMNSALGGAFNPLSPASWKQYGQDMSQSFKILWLANKTGPEAAEALGNIQFHVGRVGDRDVTMTGAELLEKMRSMGAIDSGLWHGELTGLKDTLNAATSQMNVSHLGAAAKKGSLQLGKVNGAVENASKIAFVTGRLRAGDSLEEAIFKAQEYLFNYKNVAPGVQWARKWGIAPFMAWQAKNIPLQLEMMIKRPGYGAALMHLKDAVEGNAGRTREEDRATVEKITGQLGVRLSQNKDGSYNVITAEGVIPLADLPGFIEAFGDLSAGNLERFSKYLANMTGGPVRGAYALFLGRDFRTGKDLVGRDPLRTPLGDVSMSSRYKTALRETGGRPIGLLEEGADYLRGRKDRDTGQPMTAGSLAAWGSFALPFRVDTKGSPADKKALADSIDFKIRNLRSLMNKQRREGQTRALEENQKEVQRLQLERLSIFRPVGRAARSMK